MNKSFLIYILCTVGALVWFFLPDLQKDVRFFLGIGTAVFLIYFLLKDIKPKKRKKRNLENKLSRFLYIYYFKIMAYVFWAYLIFLFILQKFDISFTGLYTYVYCFVSGLYLSSIVAEYLYQLKNGKPLEE